MTRKAYMHFYRKAFAETVPPWPRLRDLKNHVWIENQGETRDTDGGVLPAWAKFKEAFVAIRTNKRGAEKYAAKGIDAAAYCEIGLRYQPGITRKMRVNLDGRIFNIFDINNYDNRDQWLILSCTEDNI